MSTVDRVVELAVRNDVRVPGLAAWDESARAIQAHPPPPMSAAEADALFSTAIAQTDPDIEKALTVGDVDAVLPEQTELPEVLRKDGKDTPYDKLSVPQKIRLAMVGNAVDRAKAIRDPIKMVAVAAIKAGGVTEFEAAGYASNPGLPEDVIKYIAQKRDWTKAYSVKFSLCRNPKTPVTETMRLLPFLREKDLQGIMRSKGIPSAVVAQARKLMSQRTAPAKK
jgi:hypothetical protein